MGNDRDGIAETFDIIESHLRAKGHTVRRDDSGGSLHLGCAGVMIDRPAGCGTFVTATTPQAQATVLAALADLDAGENANEIDEVRAKLARAVPITNDKADSWLSRLDVPDCNGCDLPCDVLDAIGYCDLDACDVPGCDLC